MNFGEPIPLLGGVRGGLYSLYLIHTLQLIQKIKEELHVFNKPFEIRHQLFVFRHEVVEEDMPEILPESRDVDQFEKLV